MSPETRISIAESKRLYSVKAAAEFFDKSERWVKDRVKAGELEGFRAGTVMVSGRSINAFLSKRRM